MSRASSAVAAGKWLGAERKRGCEAKAVLVPDDETDRLVSGEIARSLRIAHMRGGDLVAHVLRAPSGRLAGISRKRVRRVIDEMIADGAVEEFDAHMAVAAGVGCPCCAGGRDMFGAAVPRPVLRLAGSDDIGYTVSHAAYRLLEAWSDEHGWMDVPSMERLAADLCRRGRYAQDEAVEAVRLLVKWRVLSVRNGGIEVNAAAERGRSGTA